jgi:Na+/H+ antiporter NhaA
MRDALYDFFKLESAGGICLVAAAALDAFYDLIFSTILAPYLFVGSLAFPEADAALLFDERVGIILGSLISGLAGYVVLRASLRPSTR